RRRLPACAASRQRCSGCSCRHSTPEPPKRNEGPHGFGQAEGNASDEEAVRARSGTGCGEEADENPVPSLEPVPKPRRQAGQSPERGPASAGNTPCSGAPPSPFGRAAITSVPPSSSPLHAAQLQHSLSTATRASNSFRISGWERKLSRKPSFVSSRP